MVDVKIIKEALDAALSTGGDFAEFFFEETAMKTISLIDLKHDSTLDKKICGVGIRVYLGLKSTTASTTDLSREGILSCAKDCALSISDGKRIVPEIYLKERINTNIHKIEVAPASVSAAYKAELVRRAQREAKGVSPSISQVTGWIGDVDRRILVANSEGLLTTDRQVRLRMAISAVASNGVDKQTGSCSPGRRMGIELFDMITPEEIGREASRQALVNLSAGYCSAGVMPVAIDNGFGGVIFHEACGHSLEASSVAYGNSQFSGKLGEMIANEKVTAIDDGTIPNGWGSINIDDEGTPSQKKILIENGVLKRYMVDRFNGRRMNMPSSGSSRRQDYSYTPTSRMTNTYIAAGNDRNEDIISSIDLGLYAAKMGGGSVNPATGDFNFAVAEGYMIRDGKICEAVRGASLIGKGSDIIKKIDMVGPDMETGQGMCGSSSGSVPTDVGQPLIRVSSITVGGR